MTAKKRNIIIVCLAVIGIAVAVVFNLFNKGPVNVKDVSGTKVQTSILYEAFVKDSTAAKKMYLNNILEVSGMVSKVSKNQENGLIVMFQTNEGGAYVNCTMEETVTDLEANKPATLKGICTGMGMGDADMGIMGDVYLVRCYLVK